MRLFYLYLWIVFQYSFRLYFKKIIIRNKSRFAFGRTIFVSNHQGSFMDPLLIASMRKPIVYFMVRSDVFNRYTERIFWSAHMLPIYRQRDGIDTIEKNQAIFEKTDRLLARRRNILIFGEGFTDDRIQRRLHPIKKGPARIGFSALEADGWKHPIYLQGLGINYADFNVRNSEVLVDAGKQICLNDFQEAYRQNPAKTIADVTRMLDADMRTLIPDVKDPEWSDFHEDIMMVTRKGIHPHSYNPKEPFEKRWLYALRLAQWIDDQNQASLDELQGIRSNIASYKQELVRLGIHEEDRYRVEHHSSRMWQIFVKLMVLFPIAIVGFLHAGLWIYLIKWWVEKSFKRPVYWGSTKMVLAIFIVPLVNLPWCFILPRILPWEPAWNWGITVLYFLSIGIFANIYLHFLDSLITWIRWDKTRRKNLIKVNEMNLILRTAIKEKIPVL